MGSDLYDEQFGSIVKAGGSTEDAYWQVVMKDIEDAADLFKPIYDVSNGVDGYISVEVSPLLAHDAQATIDSAVSLHNTVNRPNVYIKIPATKECVPAIEAVIAKGISVNVTLVFSLQRYEEVMDAYISGLEKVEGDLSHISSVASFFVSRVDVLVDRKLEEIGSDEAQKLLGKAAVSQAKLAYQIFQKKFSGPQWEGLEKRGAKKQRLLFASTGTKNPKYPDTLYIHDLIGPETVNTMPDAAMFAFLEHGIVERTVDRDVADAQATYDAIERLGIHWKDVEKQLEDEGVASFKKSFESLMATLDQKAAALQN